MYLPDGKGGYVEPGTERAELKIPPIEIPQHLREDILANPHLETPFFEAVKKALDASLNHPETALREPSVRAIKQRIEQIYMAIEAMRYDLKYPLKKCFDLLPGAVMTALRGGGRIEDEMAKHDGQTAWPGQGKKETMLVGEEMDHEEPEGPVDK